MARYIPSRRRPWLAGLLIPAVCAALSGGVHLGSTPSSPSFTHRADEWIPGGWTHVVEAAVPAVEARGVWIVRDQLTSASNIEWVIDDAYRHGFNLVIVQVVGRGDAYYKSDIIPRAEALATTAPGFDPLALAIKSAHARGMKVHAWVNDLFVYPIGDRPVSAKHVVNAHADWLTYDYTGKSIGAYTATEAGAAGIEGIFLEPGLPEVRRHVASVFQEIVSRYQVDGIHHDFVRYPSQNFGYHPLVRAAFKSEYGLDPSDLRTKPVETRTLLGNTRVKELSDAWNVWRQAAVTVLVTEIFQAVRSIRPTVEISAAVFPMHGAVAIEKGQAWYSWLQQGWIDIAMPMAYMPEAPAFAYQIRQAVANKGRGTIYAGIGVYTQLNQPKSIVEKVQTARTLGASGVVFFDYGWLRKKAGVLDEVTSQAFQEPAVYPTLARSPSGGSE